MNRQANPKIYQHVVPLRQKNVLVIWQKRLLTLVVMNLSILNLIPPVFAQDDEFTRPMLRGLQGIHVIVEQINPEVERIGLTRSELQAKTEQQIRRAGIKVLSKEEQILEKGRPYLYVYLHIIKFGTRITRYLFYIQVQLNQDVYLVRDPTIWGPAVTWSTGGTGIDFDLDNVRSIVKKKVDDFINTFLIMNPKR